jgi:hypothetical protein
MKLILIAIAGLILAAVTLLTGGLLLNQLPLNQPPGLATRLSTYFNTHVAEISEDSEFPELRSPRFDLPAAQLFTTVQDAVTNLGWQIDKADPAQDQLQAVVTSRLWRFQDDVVVQVRSRPNGGSTLDARSVSRVGEGDLGTNSRHLIDLLQAIQAAVAQPNA